MTEHVQHRHRGIWRGVVALVLALWGAAVWAQAAGSVVQLTGTLSA